MSRLNEYINDYSPEEALKDKCDSESCLYGKLEEVIE
jgi:hypothetical protein